MMIAKATAFAVAIAALMIVSGGGDTDGSCV